MLGSLVVVTLAVTHRNKNAQPKQVAEHSNHALALLVQSLGCKPRIIPTLARGVVALALPEYTNQAIKSTRMDRNRFRRPMFILESSVSERPLREG